MKEKRELSLATRKKMSQAAMGHKPPKSAFKKGQIPWNKTNIIKNCEICKKDFRIRPYLLKKGMGRYCGQKCFGIARSRNFRHSEETKRKMSLAQGGTGIPVITTKRYYHLQDKKYKIWRTKVFKRDKWICQTCGIRGVYLEPHHIKGWSKHPELRYEVENGVTLCRECHRLTRKKH